MFPCLIYISALYLHCRAKIPLSEHLDCIVMGKRYTAVEALEAKIVHQTGRGIDQVIDKAIELSKTLVKEKFNPEALKNLKMDLYEKEYISLGKSSKL